MPPAIRDKYRLSLPPYPGTAQCVRLGPGPDPSAPARFDLWEAPAPEAARAASEAAARTPADMRIKYEAGTLTEEDLDPDPIRQFDQWFKQAAADPVRTLLWHKQAPWYLGGLSGGAGPAAVRPATVQAP